MVNSPTFKYDGSDFPPLQPFVKDHSRHAPKIQHPKMEILPDGQHKPVSEAESVLNWQTENALAQNKLLVKINESVSQVQFRLEDVREKVTQQSKQVKDLITALERRLATIQFYLPERGVSPRTFMTQQAKEIECLKNQISYLKETGKLPEPANPASFGNCVAPKLLDPNPFGQFYTTSSTLPQSFPSPAPSSSKQFDLVAWYKQEKAKEAEKKQQSQVSKKRHADTSDGVPSSEMMISNQVSELLSHCKAQQIPSIAGITVDENSTSSEPEDESYSEEEEEDCCQNIQMATSMGEAVVDDFYFEGPEIPTSSTFVSSSSKPNKGSP